MGMAVTVIIIAISYFSNLNKADKKVGQAKTQNKTGGVSLVTCPMCNMPLEKGQNLISKVYRPMDVPDQRCTINGCPHCYPRLEPGLKRICPVCHKEVELDQSLTARLFNKAMGKKHVHVVGCSNCHKPRAQ